MKKVFIVIPVHNRLKYTKKCLVSLSRQNYKNFTVVLVDDGSTDKTKKYYKKHFPHWKIIKGTGNWWWTRSMYEGVKYSISNSSKGDFILTMNNDCFSKSNYLSQIVKASTNNNRAIVGSLILDAETPSKVIGAGVRINWKKGLVYGVAKTVTDKASFYSKREIINRLDTLPGKGTLVPIEVFNKIGNFNYIRLPHYVSDYEFFCKAKKSDFSLIVSTKSKLYNFSKQTGSSHVRKKRASYKEITHLFFGRKSKLNIFDHINFILLCCPNKYKPINFYLVFNKILTYSLRLFPFYHIVFFINVYKSIKFRLRLFVHNVPILVNQTSYRLINFLSEKPTIWKYLSKFKFIDLAKMQASNYKK
jgi:GT2 family glycosyltransferase